jgi:hypothetical protein
MKIVSLAPGASFEIDVKRLHLPFRVEDNCPVCGRVCVYDLRRDYLSYPVVGDDVSLGFYCEDGHEVEEWTQQVRLWVSLELV